MDYDIEKIKDLVSGICVFVDDLIAQLGMDVPTVDSEEPAGQKQEEVK